MRHVKQNHAGKNEENVKVNIKKEEQKDGVFKQKYEKNKKNEDKKLEELLYRMICAFQRKTEGGREYMYISAFERKNEIGKEALEMIRKYGVDIEKMSEVIQKAIKFRMRIEKLEKRFTESADETRRKLEKESADETQTKNDII